MFYKLLPVIMFIVGMGFGRGTYIYMKDEELEQKREQLESYHKELLEIAEYLEAKEKHIRNKWQAMVDDISKYEASIRQTDGKWSEWDDVYLNSWSSAEK